MKKHTLIIAAMTATVALASCAGGEKKSEETTTQETKQENVETAKWKVDTAASNIRWTGGTAGAMVYSHFGNLDIKSGKLMTEGDQISAGSFVVDMTSIDPKDDGYSEENPASKLVGHLSSPDFFNVAAYPEATFEVTSFDNGIVNGNLTIRGNTHPEVIEINAMEMAADGTMKATGTLVFDRQKYDVAWEHYLEDTVLSDDIKLEITLVAKKA